MTKDQVKYWKIKLKEAKIAKEIAEYEIQIAEIKLELIREKQSIREK